MTVAASYIQVVGAETAKVRWRESSFLEECSSADARELHALFCLFLDERGACKAADIRRSSKPPFIHKQWQLI